MAKKKFTKGLDSLFSDPDQEIGDSELVLFSNKKEGTRERSKRSTGKDFSSDLQSFLAEAFEESFEEQIGALEQARKKQTGRRPKKKVRSSLSGLDMLIRSTVQPKEMEVVDGTIRRVTLLLDQRKLEQLKEIARQEKTYLKNIIDEIVGGYLRNYQQKKKG